MTDASYNGVVLTNVTTDTFDEELVYEDSGTDPQLHKFTIAIIGYVSMIANCSTVGMSTNSVVSTAAGQVAARTLLMEPRQRFTMTVGGVTLLDIGPNNGKKYGPFGDVNNGPKPKSFKILGIYGNATMKVRFEIEVATVECISANGNSQGVLSNRWSMKDSYDNSFYCTRSITGRLRVADLQLDPQKFRAWCFPPLEAGYRRDSIEVTTSMDGLTLDYSVVDKEIFASAPGDATDWECEHVRMTGDGMSVFDELNLKLTAPKDADKSKLIALAVLIVNQKLAIGDTSSFLQQAAVIDHLEKNQIEVRARVQRFPGGSQSNSMAVFNLPVDNFGKPLVLDGYDKDLSRTPALFGTTDAAGLLVSFLQTPCDDNHKVPQAAQSPGDESQVDRIPSTKTYTYTGTIPPNTAANANYDSQQSEFVYTHYELSSSYEQVPNTIQLPIAASINPANTSAPTCLFVQMAPPMTSRVVSVTAQRVGANPTMPDPNQITFNGVPLPLIGHQIIEAPQAPQLTADGVNKRYSLSMRFRAGLPKAPSASDSLAIGHLPWDAFNIADNNLSPDNFVTGIA